MLKVYKPYGFTILDILETESQYPGLLNSVDVALWYDELMDEKLNPKDKK